MLKIATSNNEEEERPKGRSIHKNSKTAMFETVAWFSKEIPNYIQHKRYLLSKAVHSQKMNS